LQSRGPWRFDNVGGACFGRDNGGDPDDIFYSSLDVVYASQFGMHAGWPYSRDLIQAFLFATSACGPADIASQRNIADFLHVGREQTLARNTRMQS
jgi:hypothetical protein